jgi:xylose isomerase
MRHAVLTAFFGLLRDRFCAYQQPLSIADKLQRASEVPGVEGVEVIFPDEVRAAGEIAGDLARLGLEVAAINVNLKGDRVFQHGALSSPDPGVRRRAVDLLREGKRLARELGARRVSCAPLADGYDGVFQVDYRCVWRRMVESVASAAEEEPDVVLHLEHKPADPRRAASLLDTPAKVIRLCRDVGHGSVGITFNVGHAIAGGHLPAAAFADVLYARLPYYIHFCDATPAWDWDLRVGTHHLWAWAEFLFYLELDGYDGWLTADTFPVRQDALGMFAANLSITDALRRWLRRLDAAAVVDACDRQHAGLMLAELERCLPVRA